MKKNIILKVMVFIVVATVTAFFVNKLNNLGLDKVSKEMDEPTLPIVYCQLEGDVVNRMFGYTHTMSTSLMRDGIVPLNDQHGVELLVNDEYSFGKEYSYELRSIAGDSLVEEGELELVDTDIVTWHLEWTLEKTRNMFWYLLYRARMEELPDTTPEW